MLKNSKLNNKIVKYSKWIIILVLIFIFLLSLAVRYQPIWHKGYPSDVNANSLILARNLSLTGEYSLEDEKNIILSSDLIKAKGVDSNYPNKLTSVLGRYIFDFFGFNQEFPIHVSLLVFALTNVLLFLLILKLFNFYLAFLFSLFDIFMPFVIRGSSIAGFYEWAMLFFVAALLIYLTGKKKGFFKLFFSGLFFGLAFLARNAFLFSFVPFLIYDFWKNRSYKRVIVFFLSFVLVLGTYSVFNLPDASSNLYFSTFFGKSDIGYEGHLFPDPYTYHFEKEEFIKSIESPTGEQILFLQKYEGSVNLSQKISSYFNSFKFYVREVFRIINLGGVLILFLLILGATYLYKKKNPLLKLFYIWIGIWFISLIVLKTSNWDHFLEIRFPIVLLVSLGVYWISKFIWGLGIKDKFKYLWIIIFVLTITLHFVEANRWTFHEIYNTSRMDNVLKMVEVVKQKQNNQQHDVIGVGSSQKAADVLNYYTDQSVIYFSPQTVEKLLSENRLDWAFEQFGITHVIGYDSELNREIINQTGVMVLK